MDSTSTANLSGLPVELIISIIESLKEVYHVERDADKRIPSYRWIVATWLCREWRSTALAAPTLWCTINEDYPLQVVQEFIERSGTHAPLLVHITSSADEILLLPKQSQVLQQLRRIRRLDIKVNARVWPQINSAWSAALMLEELTLAPVDVVEDSPIPSTSINMAIALSLNAPSLKKIDLTEYSLTSPFLSKLSGLTHLALAYPTLHMPLCQFTQAVQHMEQLKSLELYDALDPESPVPLAHESAHALKWPALQKLSIQDTKYNITLSLLQSIHASSTFPIDVTLRGEDVPEHLTGRQAFMEIFSAYNVAHGPTTAHIHEIAVYANTGIVHVRITKACREKDFPEPGVDIWLDARAGNITQADGTEIAQKLLLSNGASISKELSSFETDVPFTCEQWITAFQKLSVLNSLRLHGTATRGLLDYLVRYYELNGSLITEAQWGHSQRDRRVDEEHQRQLLGIPLPLTLERLLLFDIESEDANGLTELRLAKQQTPSLSGSKLRLNCDTRSKKYVLIITNNF